ncbi:hypothetical protein PR048_016944 [Dryococelus australis]|uniref:Uncharacterized protein n=1 Tax=Dryococelus australis TaxID=614101 RepID=A0ABQ9H842_9NEOP|nr:hypothetical protein PR048_016944 [Dryococelus australis]
MAWIGFEDRVKWISVEMQRREIREYEEITHQPNAISATCPAQHANTGGSPTCNGGIIAMATGRLVVDRDLGRISVAWNQTFANGVQFVCFGQLCLSGESVSEFDGPVERTRERYRGGSTRQRGRSHNSSCKLNRYRVSGPRVNCSGRRAGQISPSPAARGFCLLTALTGARVQRRALTARLPPRGVELDSRRGRSGCRKRVGLCGSPVGFLGELSFPSQLHSFAAPAPSYCGQIV